MYGRKRYLCECRGVLMMSMVTLLVMTTHVGAQVGGAGAVPTSGAEESLWSLLWKGGPVMIPLALASVLAVAIAFERLFSLRRRKIIPERFVAGLKDSFTESEIDVERAVSYCDRSVTPVGRIFRAGIRNLSRGEELIEKAIEDAGSREVDKMKRSLRGLAVIASVSPLLGLLGTVYGMIDAFQTATSVGLGKAEVLAQGIYQALVTTATGLTIAIPALLVFQYLNTRVDALVDEIDDMGIEFMEYYIDKQGKRE